MNKLTTQRVNHRRSGGIKDVAEAIAQLKYNYAGYVINGDLA